jgi:hypothetical protein
MKATIFFRKHRKFTAGKSEFAIYLFYKLKHEKNDGVNIKHEKIYNKRNKTVSFGDLQSHASPIFVIFADLHVRWADQNNAVHCIADRL